MWTFVEEFFILSVLLTPVSLTEIVSIIVFVREPEYRVAC